jgi:phosphoserine phosphatase
MRKEVIVYDFDKTLTYQDTLFGFFQEAGRVRRFYYIKRSLYFIAMVFAKLSLIDNDTLKRFGVVLFLKGKEIKFLQDIIISYQPKISFNRLYQKITERSESDIYDIYIVSASFEEYLEGLFPPYVKIVGSKLLYENDKIIGIARNCYKGEKVKALYDIGIKKIDLLYTDSFSDYPLAEIARKIVIVRGDELYECKDINDFRGYFTR